MLYITHKSILKNTLAFVLGLALTNTASHAALLPENFSDEETELENETKVPMPTKDWLCSKILNSPLPMGSYHYTLSQRLQSDLLNEIELFISKNSSTLSFRELVLFVDNAARWVSTKLEKDPDYLPAPDVSEDYLLAPNVSEDEK